VVPLLRSAGPGRGGSIVVVVDDRGERDFYSDRGPAALVDAADVARGVAAAARWVHVSGYALFGPHGADVARAARDGAASRGLGTSVGASSSSGLVALGTDRFLRMTAGMDLLFANHEEAATLTGGEAPAGAAAVLSASFGTVVVTCGRDGAVAASAGRCWRVPAVPGVAADTTGAGDAFAAGFLAARLRDAGVDECLERGAATASRAVARLGAWPTLPPKEP
jgi:sugar/nucleoside kinase (ribokinase family)